MTEPQNYHFNGQERLYELSELRSMDRKALLEIARSRLHLWPQKLGLLNSKTLVKNLEYVFLDKDSRYRTTAPIPSSVAGAIKKRCGGGRKLKQPPNSMEIPSISQSTSAPIGLNSKAINNIDSSNIMPSLSLSSTPGATAGHTESTQRESSASPEEITIHLLDKRDDPPADVAVDVLIDSLYISRESCFDPGMLKVKTTEIVRLLERNDLIRGFIKLSTPHRRIPTAYQPFLTSQIGIALLDTPVSMEYLLARDAIVDVLVKYALEPYQRETIINTLKRKREIEHAVDESPASTSTQSTSGSDFPLHIARVQANLRKARGTLIPGDKGKALKWLTEQAVSRSDYALFNRIRGSDKAQNPEIVRIWLFVRAFADEYLNTLVKIPDVASKVKITKKMMYSSLAIHETTFNTILHAADLVQKYGEGGPCSSPEVIERLKKVIIVDRANNIVPEGRRSLLNFLERQSQAGEAASGGIQCN